MTSRCHSDSACFKSDCQSFGTDEGIPRGSRGPERWVPKKHGPVVPLTMYIST